MSKKDCIAAFGKDEGTRLFSQVTISKNTNNFKTARTSGKEKRNISGGVSHTSWKCACHQEERAHAHATSSRGREVARHTIAHLNPDLLLTFHTSTSIRILNPLTGIKINNSLPLSELKDALAKARRRSKKADEEEFDVDDAFDYLDDEDDE